MRDQLFAVPQPAAAEPPIYDGPMPVQRWSYADVTERLLAEFGPRYGLKVVSDVVRRCQTGEDGLRTLIAPEALEQLARTQLRDTSPTVMADSAL